VIYRFWYRPWRYEADREDIRSEDGAVTFNWIQQRPVDNTERPPTPVEEAGTTDPLGVTSG
jgi:hypothetical protein